MPAFSRLLLFLWMTFLSIQTSNTHICLPFARLLKGKIFGSSPKGRGRRGIGAPPSTLERWPEKEDTRMRVLRLRVLHSALLLIQYQLFSTSSIINYCSRQVCFKFHLVDFDRVGEWVASKIKENATTDMSKKAINWTMKRVVSYFYLLQNKWRKCDSVIVCKRTMLIWASVIALSRINCNSECFYLSMSQHFQFCNFRAVYIAMSRKSVFLLFSNKFYMWEPL